MIEAEKANVVMINGDFGYGASPTAWKNRVLASVDPETLPIIGTLGNHDVGIIRKLIFRFSIVLELLKMV